MIVVRIWEGLGNQLFQYAYARALQERLHETVYLDRRHINRGDLPQEKADVDRSFGLQHFQTTLKYADTRKIRGLNWLDEDNGKRMINYNLGKIGIGKWKIVEDAGHVTEIIPPIYEPKDFTYINAHCNNRFYYSQYRDILLDELQLKKELKISSELDDIMKHENTVSLHIRLTDYLKHPGTVCEQRYYDKAIKYMREKTENPFLIIFTDDTDMAKRRFRFSNNVYWVSDEGLADYEELMLMSRCNHNIMAGSTFSYWGAWLNQNPDKIVTGPKTWMKNAFYEKEWRTF
jgi:hypothetical protein